jgi:hypothetical protein
VSRAEAVDSPGVRTALRTAAIDLYYHSIRLVPANLAWAGVAMAGLFAASWGAPVVALVALPCLALPLVGIGRLAGHIARRQEVVLTDAVTAARSLAVPALVAGGIMVGAVAVLGTNLVAGLGRGDLIGVALATLAGWGLVALWLAAFPFWVLLADPARADWPPLDVARLAVVLLLERPGRMVGLGVALAAILAVGTVLVAALLTVAVAYAALATAHVVLPVADRSVARLSGFPPVRIDPHAGDEAVDTVEDQRDQPEEAPAR